MKTLSIFSVPYLDAQLVAIVPPSLPSSMDIITPFFRGIKLSKDYNLLDEVLRQSDRLNENEKIKWIIKWSHSKDCSLC